MNCKYLLLFYCLLAAPAMFGQFITIDGYAFESDNRGYLNEVKVLVLDQNTKAEVAEAYSDNEGHFVIQVPNGSYELMVSKNLFADQKMTLADASTVSGDKYFFKITLKRNPGYLFDITLANKRDSGEVSVDAIHNARIEVFNNTTNELEFEDRDHETPNFIYTLTKGNHYTILMRKEGYLAKRIEAFVDVKGCILCIEGLSKLSPGVTDNLTEGHQMGTLLANVEMETVDVGSTFKIENLYYDLGEWKISAANKTELQKVVQLMRDNPLLEIEIGSHTDSRGKDELNIKLSQKRASAVVEFLIEEGGVAGDRLKGIGFGDTQLVNHCAEDVPCSEVNHQENRRTEMRITGIRVSNLADKTLAEIKEIEKMDQLIKELQNQEIIEVKEGEELPEELKKELEKKNKNN